MHERVRMVHRLESRDLAKRFLNAWLGSKGGSDSGLNCRARGDGYKTIYNWIKQADRNEDKRADILSSSERDELRCLRKENKKLKQERGVCLGRKRVARLMRQANLRGVSRRGGPQTTTRRTGSSSPPDLVNRSFNWFNGRLQ